jgi:predicted  nucleic acid-binding Zn-ribbon protein
MSDESGLRGRVTRQGEEAIGKVAQELLENPVVSRALAAAFETRERVTRGQELAMSALNLPSAADLERLTRRLRNVSQRLEAIEDGLDRIEQRMDSLSSATALGERLTGIEDALARLEASLRERAGGQARLEASLDERATSGKKSGRARAAPPAPSDAPPPSDRPE